MSTKTKTFEECCDEVANKTPYGNTWTAHILNLGLKLFQDAAELYASDKIKRAIELARGKKDILNYQYTEQEIIDKLSNPK